MERIKAALGELRDFLVFVGLACRAWRSLGEHGCAYAGRSRFGVTDITLFIGRGREAWRVTVVAAEFHRRS